MTQSRVQYCNVVSPRVTCAGGQEVVIITFGHDMLERGNSTEKRAQPLPVRIIHIDNVNKS